MEPVRHVLAAIDFQPASLHALDYAARLARSVGARLTLVHACDLSPRAREEAPEEIARAGSHADAQRGIDALAQSIRDEGVDVGTCVRDGAPAAEIVDTARWLGADLVVCGSHGRRGAPRVLLGSVAEDVARRSPIPVTVVHEWSFASRADAAERLAKRIAVHAGEIDLTLAITRGAVPLAVAVADALRTRVDTYLVEPILDEDGVPTGAIAENGILLPADGTPPEIEGTERARAIVERRARWLGTDALGDLTGYAVLLVADAVPTRALALVAAQEVRRRGARHVSLAVPVCSAHVVATIAPMVDRTIALEVTHLTPETARPYRDDDTPSNVEAADMLVRATVRRTSEAAEPPARA